VDGGANINFSTTPDLGFTPLMYATTYNHAGVVKLLLERGGGVV
jgi:ankyrin repeat protein